MKTLTLLTLLALAACTPKETASSTGDAAVTTPSVSVATTASAPPANADNDPLPSHSDVAKQVRTEITKDNYKAKLDEIEKSSD